MKNINEEIESYSFIRFRWKNHWLLWGDMVLGIVLINFVLTLIFLKSNYGFIAAAIDAILIPTQWVAYWVGMRKNRKEMEERHRKLDEQLQRILKKHKQRRKKKNAKK